jgi:hypothetical protein
MITESDELGRALDHAARLWPELKNERGQLLRKVLEAGIAELLQDQTGRKSQRLNQIKTIAGSMSDIWPTNWREELANDWPR